MLQFDKLYDIVRDIPIIDWHNHLDAASIDADRPFGSLYETWVKPDPYKHRAMRICGVDERFITGDASESEKWNAWRETQPKLVGNPLYAWANAELDLLGIDGTENVSLGEWSPSRLLKKLNVEYLSPCVTANGLESFPKAKGIAATKIVPSLRLNCGEDVMDSMLAAFHDAGCRIVDISIDDFSTVPDHFESLKRIAAFAAKYGWTQLLHIGALRATSSRLAKAAGPAGGYAAMRAPVDPALVVAFLNGLEEANSLPRTILLSLNPEAHASLAVLSGSFVEAGKPAKVQLGPAWWWCDHAEGIRDVLEKTAAYGVLSTFIGMTTDSRSILSLVRHDYFRRLLCNWVAWKISNGDFPDDEAVIRPMLDNVCYNNAKALL